MPFVVLTRKWSGGQGSAAWSRSFDAVEVEDHTFETESTDEPVDIGVSLTDHAFDKPIKISITAAVSDIPPPGKENDIFSAEGPSRSLSAYAWLRSMQRAHEPFSVQTGLDLFPSMMIGSLRIKKDAPHANILYFTVELKEILWASTAVVFYPTTPKTARAAAAKKDDGNKTGEDTDAATLAKVRKSFLKMAVDFVKGS